jgi:hypothetical protein
MPVRWKDARAAVPRSIETGCFLVSGEKPTSSTGNAGAILVDKT